MSQLKKMTLKMGALGLILWGGYSWVNHTPENAVAADKVIVTTLDKTDLAMDINQVNLSMINWQND